jgi:hypothetical protein
VLVEKGAIELDATLDDLGIDDATPLTEQERRARVRDVIAARSGEFLPAAYAPSDQDADRPARGSHAPGTHWYYNNWDFNVAGVIVERLATGEALYAAFDRPRRRGPRVRMGGYEWRTLIRLHCSGGRGVRVEGEASVDRLKAFSCRDKVVEGLGRARERDLVDLACGPYLRIVVSELVIAYAADGPQRDGGRE